MGYEKSSKEELEFIVKVFKKSGILLDPVYTGKTVYTLYNLISKIEPTFDYRTDETAGQFLTKLRGNRILFIHKGGLIGSFAEGKFDLIMNKKIVYDWFNENIQNLEL